MHRIQHLVTATILTLVLSSLMSESALAASPSTQGQNPVALTVPHTVTGTTKLQREVFGFALASSLADPTVGYPSWNFSLLSTVAFFGLHVNDGGSLASDSGMGVWNSSQLTGLLSTAHASGTKVVVTVILQDFGPGTPHMCTALTNIATTVSQTVAQVTAKGVDGVNLDYEGLNGTCPNGQSAQAMMTELAHQMRAALPAGSYLSVDTYASSASDPVGFFDIPGLNKYVDSFFVMAYDLEYSNAGRPPTNCASFCLGPTSPLAGYYYNDTNTTAQYSATVPAAKVILGVPYFGRKACVTSTAQGVAPNAYPIGSVVADSYLDASTEASDPHVLAGSFIAHRDANDPSGARWDTWWNGSIGCTRELYWDDVWSLGNKYDLIWNSNLRGVGIWTLNYGGGAPELWAALNTHFACSLAMTMAATQTTTTFNVGLSGCAATSFDVEQYDSTQNHGWYPLKPVAASGGSATAVIDGFPGYSYQVRARAHTASGVTSAWTVASTSVAPTAAFSHPFKGLYTLDAFGGIDAVNSPPVITAAYWPGWKIARAARAMPGSIPQAGVILDGYGGVHWYGVPMPINSPAYWPGWDIARDIAWLPDGTGGYLLDGYGGLHPFSVNGHTPPPFTTGGPYWAGWDIARKVVIFSDGKGGIVMDGYGGLHSFGIGAPKPPTPTGGPYWGGWTIARDVVLVPGTHGGYVLDGYGGIHPFSGASPLNTPAYWAGWDIARSVWLLPGSTLTAPAGYLLDGYGGVHQFGGAPALTTYPYWPGKDLAINLIGY